VGIGGPVDAHAAVEDDAVGKVLVDVQDS